MNILKAIAAFFTGAASKIKKALTFGKDAVNIIKQVVDSPLLELVTKLTVTQVDDLALVTIKAHLNAWLIRMNWAEKKVSDFDETTLPHVLNSIAAETAKIKAELDGVDLSRQQAIASAQVVYDGKIVA